MKKVTKAQVKSLVKKNGVVQVWLCPSKSYPNPDHPFNLALPYLIDVQEITPRTEENSVYPSQVGTSYFDDMINKFHYYNCNAEVGKTVHYYIG